MRNGPNQKARRFASAVMYRLNRRGYSDEDLMKAMASCYSAGWRSALHRIKYSTKNKKDSDNDSGQP